MVRWSGLCMYGFILRGALLKHVVQLCIAFNLRINTFFAVWTSSMNIFSGSADTTAPCMMRLVASPYAHDTACILSQRTCTPLLQHARLVKPRQWNNALRKTNFGSLLRLDRDLVTRLWIGRFEGSTCMIISLESCLLTFDHSTSFCSSFKQDLVQGSIHRWRTEESTPLIGSVRLAETGLHVRVC